MPSYSVQQLMYMIEDIAKTKYPEGIPYSMQSTLNEFSKRLVFNLEFHTFYTVDDQLKFMKSDIENSIVRAYYSFFFEITFTHEKLMSIKPEQPANTTFLEYKKKNFFEEGEGGEKQVLSDVDREITINGHKISMSSVDRIENDINIIIHNKNAAEHIIKGYSQRPSYMLSNLIAGSLEVNDSMLFTQTAKKILKSTIFISNKISPVDKL